MIYFLKILRGFVVVSLAYANAPQTARLPANGDIRVAIKDGVSTITLAGEKMVISAGPSSHRIGSKATVAASGSYITVNGRRFRPPARISAARGIIYVNDKQYRGDIVIHRGKRGLLVVNELPLETYLVGLINAEVNSSWPIESLKAQAVVARTFALKKSVERRSKPFDLRSDVSDQVYHGSSLEDAASLAAVQSTSGQALTYNGKLIQAYYHSTCGGHTASSLEVWGDDLPYLPGVKCDWCVDSPRYFWKYNSDGEQLGKALRSKNVRVGKVKRIRILSKTPSGRNYRLEVVGTKGKRAVDAALMRAAVGYTRLFSTNFELLEPTPGQFVFMGRGSGHGVGMCQWGARGMALAGKSCADILRFYYPGAKLAKL